MTGGHALACPSLPLLASGPSWHGSLHTAQPGPILVTNTATHQGCSSTTNSHKDYWAGCVDRQLGAMSQFPIRIKCPIKVQLFYVQAYKYHCATNAYSIQYNNVLYIFVAEDSELYTMYPMYVLSKWYHLGLCKYTL